MEEQVQNLKRELLREFTVNCHLYAITFESMKDQTLLIISQLSFGFNVATQVPIHLHVTFTKTGLKKHSSMKRASGNTRDKQGSKLILGLYNCN